MTDAEFAAWSAVKLFTNSINTRQGSAKLDLPSVLKDPDAQVDLYKGTRGSIRHWNNQLRQPILLATSDAVIAVAPMPKFCFGLRNIIGTPTINLRYFFALEYTFD